MTCEPHNPPQRTPTPVTALSFGDEVSHPGYGRIVVETVTTLPTGDIEILFRKKSDGAGYLVTFGAGAVLDVIA